MKERFSTVKEKSKEVDDVKREISKMKEDLIPMRLKTNMVQGKLNEYKSVLVTTNGSVVTYQSETLKIAAKVQNLIKRKEEAKENSEAIKAAVFDIFKEVSFYVKFLFLE